MSASSSFPTTPTAPAVLGEPGSLQFPDFVPSPTVSFPPVLAIDGIALLLRKTPQAVLMDRSRAPWRIPPACLAPGTRQPLWITSDVIAWLASHREPASLAPSATQPHPREPREPRVRRDGRPKKTEAAAAAAAGLTVKELRATEGV